MQNSPYGQAPGYPSAPEHSRSYSSTSQLYNQPGPSTPGQTARRQGWREWAGDKFSKAKAKGIGLGLQFTGAEGGYAARGTAGSSTTSLPSPGSPPGADVTELVTLFPGWAAKRYANKAPSAEAPVPFELEVFTSGYVISYRNRDTMTRAHRAFLRLAKGFASLPKLVAEAAAPSPPNAAPRISRSTEDLLAETGPIHLPPRPDEMDAAYETAYRQDENQASELSQPAAKSKATRLAETEDTQPELNFQEQPPGESLVNMSTDNIHRMHSNFEERLKPFWSSVVPGRTVRIHIFASPHTEDGSHPNLDDLDDESYWQYNKPLATTEVMTGTDGSFQAGFTIGWDQLCHHPRALHIAFGQTAKEHDVIVVAELLKHPQASPSQSGSVPYTPYTSSRRPRPTSSHSSSSSSSAKQPSTRSQIHIPISYSPIRVVSDIDDTVKNSGVLNGARAVFFNVFAKELEECIIPGMGEWYSDMFKKGVRFHYVSNGPYEMITILHEYFALSQLPPGSVKLKSFARRSLFNGLLTGAAGRKRAGVEEILDAFPNSRFFLIGDSGEQDLELYADLARQRPSSVLGIFIRDVSTIEGVTDPIDDPTGWGAVVAHATSSTLGIDSEANLASDSESEDESDARPSNTTRRSMTNLLVNARKKTSSISSYLSSRDREGGDPSYFDANPGTSGRSSVYATEPEDFPANHPPLVDVDPTPRVEQVSSMQGATPRPRQAAQFITEGPKATPAPSINSRPRPASRASVTTPAAASLVSIAERRSQRSGDTASSISTASSVSSGRSRFSEGGHAIKEAFRVRVEKMARVSASAPAMEDRRRAELQLRVWRARTLVPNHIVLRVFRHPEECVEAGEVLDRELDQKH
ncbi:hypothetical protein BKA70DRAFT_1093056 [Coprinopsis sp. MPI-PUGE-AT-0042]|nr:hypothetical protein BKA70DRAFT_1093056 [Coprinopsis sp. MPI-PUGE-AT-0042]